MQWPIIPDGTYVSTTSGNGVVVQRCRRAAADIRIAAAENDRDLQPYAVRMDSTGSMLTFRGHEIDVRF